MSEPVTTSEFHLWRSRAIAGYFILWLATVFALYYTYEQHQSTNNLATHLCVLTNNRAHVLEHIDTVLAQEERLQAQADDALAQARSHSTNPIDIRLVAIDLKLAEIHHDALVALNPQLIASTLVHC